MNMLRQDTTKTMAGGTEGKFPSPQSTKAMGLTEKQALEIMSMLERRDKLILFALGKKDETTRFTDENGPRRATDAALTAILMSSMTRFLAKNASEDTNIRGAMKKSAVSAERLTDRIFNTTYYIVETELLPIMNGQKSQEVLKLLAGLLDAKDMKTSKNALWALEQGAFEEIDVTVIEPSLREKMLIPEIARIPSTSDLKLGDNNSGIAILLAHNVVGRVVKDRPEASQHITELEKLAETPGIIGSTVKQMQHLMGAVAFGANPFRQQSA